MKRYVHLAVLAGLGALGCSDSEGPLVPAEVSQIDGAPLTASASDLPTIAPQTALAQQANLGPVFHFTGKANFADASFYSETAEGFVYAYVYVFQEQSAGNRETGLGYDITKCDPDFFYCETTESGFGTIPGGDVTFGANSVRLGTDTSADANPDFFRFAGDGGPLDVTWTSTPFYSTRRVSNEQSQYGSIKVRYHENSDVTSAMVQADFGSDDFSGEGVFGSSQTTQIEMSVANVVASASGSGHITVDGEQRTFSFHALQLSDGRVGGEWQRFNRAGDARGHGKVTCMTFGGETAWLGGFATKSTTTPGTVRWRVTDGGQTGSQDAISLQSVSAGADTEAYCYGQPDFPELLPIESGNISIRR